MACCGASLPTRGELVASILLAGGITLVLAGSNLSKHTAARKEFRPVHSFTTTDSTDLMAQRRARMLQTFRTGEHSKEQATAARIASADERLRSIRAELESQPAAEEKRQEEEVSAPLESEEEQMHKIFSANYRGGRDDADDGMAAAAAAAAATADATAAGSAR